MNKYVAKKRAAYEGSRSKSELARLMQAGVYRQSDRRYRTSLLPLDQLMRWTKDEIIEALIDMEFGS